MYTNKLGNLDKMDKLLETYRPSKLIREKKKKLNSLITRD